MTTIRAFEVDDLSLRVWARLFTSLRGQLGDPNSFQLHPAWEAGQAEAVRSTCTSGELDVFVAVDGPPVGFVAIALNAYHPRTGAVEMVAVDPGFQRRGVARELMAAAAEHSRRNAMDVAAVETGGDPGQAPARRTYESTGHTRLPTARYFQTAVMRTLRAAT